MHHLPAGGPGEPKDRKLSTLFKFFSGAEPAEAHRALADCRSNALVLHALLDRMPGLPGGAALRSAAALGMPAPGLAACPGNHGCMQPCCQAP